MDSRPSKAKEGEEARGTAGSKHIEPFSVWSANGWGLQFTTNTTRSVQIARRGNGGVQLVVLVVAADSVFTFF